MMSRIEKSEKLEKELKKEEKKEKNKIIRKTILNPWKLSGSLLFSTLYSRTSNPLVPIKYI